MHCVYALHSTPDFFYMSVMDAVFISLIQTNLYSIQYVLCGSGNDCRTSTGYIPP